MNRTKLHLALALAAAMLTTSAIAGPDPQVYRPLRSKQELSALAPGTQVAHECPYCGAIAVSKVGKDQTHADGFTCPVCKMKVTYLDTGGGKGPKIGLIDCVDAKTGKKMSARVCAVQK